MARAAAHNKPTGSKTEKPATSKAKAAHGSSSGSTKSSVLNDSAGKTAKRPMRTEKKPHKEGKRRAAEQQASGSGETRKRAEFGLPTPPPDRPPPVLGDSRNTTAALALLEKGIKFIYQKDFKKARHELKSLLDSYPEEPEILSRARTYLHICDREEAGHRKPTVSSDQLYALGVLDHNRGNYDGAIALFRQSLVNHPDADYVFYSLAASLAMKGETAEAIQNLKRAIELNEDNRVYAKNDSDFAALHITRDFMSLVGTISSASNSGY